MFSVTFDIESTAIKDWLNPRPDTVHCIALSINDEEPSLYVTDAEQREAGALIEEAGRVIGQNIKAFDIPALQNYGILGEVSGQIIDTQIESRARFPDLKELDYSKKPGQRVDGKLIGSHSLEAWGQRLRFPKGDYSAEMKAQGLDPWAEYNEKMGEYCLQDVRVTMKLLETLQKRPLPDDVLELEYFMADYCRRMTVVGFPFDEAAARDLLVELMNEKSRLSNELQQTIPPFYRAQGSQLFHPKKDSKIYCEGAPVTKVKLTEFNPGSAVHVRRELLRHGWEPDLQDEATLTDSGIKALKHSKGEPVDVKYASVKAEIIEKIEGIEGIDSIIQYAIVDKRLQQLYTGDQAWLTQLGPDGRLHGSYNPMGCVTGRATHSNPNMGQVPKGGEGWIGGKRVEGKKGGKPYGNECRALFKPLPGHVVVGADLSNLEGLILAHYLLMFGGEEYAEALLAGNNHDMNAEYLGVIRDVAKTWYYAMIYGGGDAKLGRILGGNAKLGERSRAKFKAEAPSFGKLIDAVSSASESKGFLKGLDGRPIWVRKSHAALNSLCQSAGAHVAKRWIWFAMKEVSHRGLQDYCVPLAFVHDELQWSCPPEYAQELGTILIAAATKAGEYLGTRLPMAAEFKVGANWSETH